MNSKRATTTRRLAGALAGTMLLTSCAQVQSMQDQLASLSEPERPLSPAEQKLKDQAADYNRTVFEGMLVGAVGGAALGAGVGAVAVSDNRTAGALTGALIGAVGGAVLGATGGYYYANLKQQYADQEQRLDALLVDLRAENQKMEGIVATVRAIVGENRAKLDRVAAELRTHKLNREQADHELSAVDGARKNLEKHLAGMRKSRERWQEIAASERAQGGGAKLAQMDHEIGKLESQIALMQTEIDGLAARRISVVG
jgi:hypothetical protein